MCEKQLPRKNMPQQICSQGAQDGTYLMPSHSPPDPAFRNVAMPLSADMPAPVNTTIFSAFFNNSAARSSFSSADACMVMAAATLRLVKAEIRATGGALNRDAAKGKKAKAMNERGSGVLEKLAERLSTSPAPPFSLDSMSLRFVRMGGAVNRGLTSGQKMSRHAALLQSLPESKKTKRTVAQTSSQFLTTFDPLKRENAQKG